MQEKKDLMKNIGGNESNNLRKYLILGGGLFVLFVIGIVAAKFLFSSPKQDTKVLLPVDIKQANNNKDTKLFNDIPIENDGTQNNNVQNNTPQKETFQKPKDTQTQAVQPQVQNVEPVVKKTTVKKTQPKKVVKKHTTPKKKQQVAKKGNYYIQVAAVTRGNPSKKFLSLITKNGFSYKIEKVNVNGMSVKRVLVGGYATYKEVKKVLPKVKAKISSSAFIKRVK